MNSTIEQIKSILNPVRVLKVKEDWMEVANFLTESNIGSAYDIKVDYASAERDWMLRRDAKIVTLIARYESLTSQPLVKEMFVTAFVKPTEESYGVDKSGYQFHLDEYQAAQKKILFEGFERVRDVCAINAKILIIFYENPKEIHFKHVDQDAPNGHIFSMPLNYTVSDLIIEISRYNRTASNPIQINFSDNFIQELIK